MYLKEYYRYFETSLQTIYSPGESAAITRTIFESLVNISKSDLLLHPNRVIEPLNLEKLDTSLSKLMDQCPVQYITREAWFYRLRFNVSESVLIPRPETEELVTQALAIIGNREPFHVLDIGCGSGCIPIAIKKNNPATTVTAIDVSADALSVARQNATWHECEIEWRQLDFLSKAAREKLPQYDLIVSNPPYIPLAEKHILDKNVVAYEPSLALFVPDNRPLLFYEEIMLFADTHLLPGGNVIVECHENFADGVKKMFEGSGWESVLLKDAYDKPRMVQANRSH